MNTLDIVLLAVACLLVIVGMAKGLIRIVIGIVAIVAAFALAAAYHAPLADRLAGAELPSGVLSLGSYAAIFLGTMIAGGLVAWFLRKAIKIAMLGWADRLAGGALGFVGALLISALLILPIVAYVPAGSSILTDSVLAPYVTVVADMARDLAPDELSTAYRDRVEDLRRTWNRQGGPPEDDSV